MSAYAHALSQLHRAILTREREAMLPLLHASTPPARLDIYIDGYRIRLANAVTADYPALAALLGDARMQALVHAYVESTPPASYTLDRYPLAFAAHVERHAPEAAALAHLESAIAEVFWLPDSPPFSPPAQPTPETLAALTLPARAASRLLHLDHRAEEYLRAFRAGENPRAPEPGETHLLVLRHANEVRRHILAPAEHALLAQLFSGSTLGEALEHAAPGLASFLPGWMERWIREGFFAGA